MNKAWDLAGFIWLIIGKGNQWLKSSGIRWYAAGQVVAEVLQDRGVLTFSFLDWSILKMEALLSLETSGTARPTTYCDLAEDLGLQPH
jgi:hypothetical protein